MLYRLLADATVVVHLAFLGYVVAGGFLAWRWRRTIWLHVAAVAWGFSTVLAGLECPLTNLENWARQRAGDQQLPSTGFISHYLTGVVYPENAVGLVRGLVAAFVIASWIGYVVLRRHRSGWWHAPV
ncbi:uncharacterized protein DUF2784 [Rhodococcus sp. AG1013]|uniref:DUF2784 domain-containing protein n=1 Tax=Rhodococcus sp. AG1013 TaxID=2183996 RepID=UPI000E09F006|nr:DUF2784 domain-containing protein [Rhodococcus sp. AG1013]RDI19924.1 uncharacterized protein DUF2784 [Rhodococcus sp. AG1013]